MEGDGRGSGDKLRHRLDLSHKLFWQHPKGIVGDRALRSHHARSLGRGRAAHSASAEALVALWVEMRRQQRLGSRETSLLCMEKIILYALWVSKMRSDGWRVRSGERVVCERVREALMGHDPMGCTLFTRTSCASSDPQLPATRLVLGAAG